MSSTSERRRAEYQRRASLNLCTTCSGALLPEWGGLRRCPECNERRREVESRYRASSKGQATVRRYRRKDPRRWATLMREMRQKRLLTGQCQDCKHPPLEDSNYCQRHRDARRAASRDYYRRKVEAKRTGRPLAPPVFKTDVTPIKRAPGRPARAPIDPVIPPPSIDPVTDYRNGELKLSKAALRYVELHNGVTARDVGDGFAADARERDGIQAALRRAARAGLVVVEGTGPERVFCPVRTRKAAA